MTENANDEIQATITLSLHDTIGGGEHEYAPTLLERIVSECAQQVLQGGKAEIRKAAIEGVRNIAHQEAAEIAKAIVSEPIQPTDRFGDSRGEPTTLRAFIADEIKRELKISKDSAYRNEQTTFTKYLKEEVRKAIDGELKAALDEAKKTIGDALRKAATDELAKRLGR